MPWFVTLKYYVGNSAFTNFAFAGLPSCQLDVNMERLVKFLSISSVVLLLPVSLVSSIKVPKRFEYKYSFKPPYLAQKDGSVPFWEYGGSK